MASAAGQEDAEIRRLRKLLRQIENLENSGRPLNKDEKLKVGKKAEVRENLNQLFGDKSAPKQPGNQVCTASNKSRSKAIADGIMKRNYDTTVSGSAATYDVAGLSVEKKRSKPEVNVACGGGDREFDPAPIAEENRKTDLIGSGFIVTQLKGHNDIVMALAINERYIISAGRDTTVKVWDTKTKREVTTLRGHSAVVTCVVLLPADQSLAISAKFQKLPNVITSIAITGSSDCCIKVWNVAKGTELRSFYTYNGITGMVYVPSTSTVITSTDGGKIEMWDIGTGLNRQSVSTTDDCITSMKLCGNYLYTGDEEGAIIAWLLNETTSNIEPVFHSNDMGATPMRHCPRKIRCIDVLSHNDGCGMILFGDDGANIKTLDCQQEVYGKMLNHTKRIGVTDAIIICQSGNSGIIISSAYDLDSGVGWINLRDPCCNNRYLGSISDQATGRILSLAALCWTDETTNRERLTIVTGGKELKTWETNASSSHNGFSMIYDLTLGGDLPLDTTDESAADTDWEGEESGGEGRYGRTYQPGVITGSSKGPWGWCSIL